MPVTVKIDTTQNSLQSQIIADATLTNDGVMTKEQVAQLASGGAALPVGQVGFGNGVGITSDPSFTFDPTMGISLDTAAAAVIEGASGASGLTLFNSGAQDSLLKLTDGGNESQLRAGGSLAIISTDDLRIVSTHFHVNGSGDFSNDGMTAKSNGVLQFSDSVATPEVGGIRYDGTHLQGSDDGGAWHNLLGGGGSSVTPTAVKTANYNAADGDLVRCNPTGGTFTVTLPAAASSQLVVVKNQSGSATAITIAAGGGDTVDGLATFVMVNPRSSVTIYSDRVSDWMIT